MAAISELVRVIAEVEGLEENFVSVYARAAREAGHISHHGRGRNAARMTLQDAACLLIAVNASTLAKHVPETIEQYAILKRKHEQEHGISEWSGKHLSRKGVLFLDALMFLLGSDHEGRPNTDRILEEARDALFVKLEPHLQTVIRVEFEAPQPLTRIKITSMKEVDHKIPPVFETKADFRYYPDRSGWLKGRSGDRTQTTTIRQKTLIAVAQILQT